MPVIPFSPLDRRVYEDDAKPVTDRAVQQRERDEEQDARRYREASDAKLQELFAQKVKTFDPRGGTSPIEAREPVTGGWRVNPPGVETPNPYLITDTPDMRSFVPSEGDEMWGQFEQDRIRKADPEDVGYWIGGGNDPMGAGGPERQVTGLSPEEIDEIRKWRASRDQDQSDLKMRQAIGAADKSPDEVARTIELAERTGANRLEVQEDPKGFEQADIMSRVQGLRQSAPKLRSWLDDPINLEVAHDDVESLGWWEQTAAFFSPGNLSIDKVGQALQSGFVDKIPEQLYGLDQMLGDANASIYKALPDWFPGKFGLVNEQVQRSLMADMKRQEMAAQGKANAPVGETWLERGIYGAAQSAPSTLVSLAITAVTKSPVVGSGSMGATTAGGAYGEARDEGKSLGDAFRYALTQGGIETATEFIPLKFLVDDLAKDSSFAKTFFRQAAAEGITEQAATFLQDASTFIELNPDKTLGEFLAERPNAALETLVASTIMSGVTTTVAKGVQAAGDQLDQNAKQKRAEELAKFIDKAVDNGANSKLLKRGTVGADKYREAVAASTDARFRIDSDAITALAQEEGVTVEQIAQAFRIDPDEMVTAIDTGSDVLVPVGNYVAAIQTAKKEIGLDGGAIHTALGPNMRANDGDLTAREMEAREQTIAQELESRKQWGERENAFADAEDRLRDTIRQQIGSLGIYNSETVDTYVEERAARVVTLATRMSEASGQPVDVEQFYKDEFAPIEFEGDWTQGTGALPQSMARKPVPIGDVELEFASKELSPQEFEAWKGARDGLSNEQIAERMNAVEPDAVVSSDDVKRWLFRSRERGYDSQKPHYNDRGTDPKTLRLIELRARGVKNPQIAAALYPKVDTQTALNRVKALASKNKAKIEERRAALSAPESRGEFSAQTATIPRKTSLFAKQRLDTLLHEGAHEYLDLLWRLSRREDANPFVVSHLAAILNWHGLSPEWSNMYDAETGVITPEGRKLHETFAETYGVYFMTGKAPTTALRSVFETIKQWMLSVYKAAKLGLDQSIRNVGPETAARIEAHERATGKRLKGQALIDFVMPAEIREVFDRSLAVDEAINAVTARLQIDGEQMAEATLKKLDPEGKWKPERRDKFMERMRNKYIQARDLAKANFQARMIDEHMRRRTAIYEAERREVEREVQSEVDERPEQRLFAWLAGKGWRKTRGDIANEAADEADAMRALAQAEELGFYEANATDASIQALQAKMVENGIVPIVLLFRTTSGRVIAFPGDSGNFGMHHDMAREVFGLGDLKMQHGVWNPRKWPTIEAMNAADTAWYDTTGTAADTIEAAPAQPRVMRGEKELAQTTGEGLLVYRGSGDAELGAGRLGTGLYLAEDPEIGAEWGGEAGTVDAYRITGKLFDLTEETAQGLENYAKRENTPAAERLFARLKAEGYVGVRDPWSGHINVFDAKDMVRTPENDAELGKTWTNYVMEMEGDPSLAQTVQPSRQLDAMGFYSAAQEAAQRVPDGIWQMGWQAARNSLAKGRDGIVPRKTEIEYLGLDAMFGDTKLKGAALKDAVLEHIAAKRLSLVENFARFDPNDIKTPTKAVMLREIDDYALADAIGLFLRGQGEGRVSLETDIGEDNSNLSLLRTTAALSGGPTYYDLIRHLDGGKKEILANGVEGDLRGKIARIIVNENFAKAMRKISAETLADEWRANYENKLVRGPGDIRLPGEDVPLFEAVIGLPEGVPGSDYRAPVSHVGGKAKGTLVTAHGEERIDDKGQRTVFVGQVQSDMAQSAREIKADQVLQQKALQEVIERSGIVDRKTAGDWMISTGGTQSLVDGYNDADLIGYARQSWAGRHGVFYNYQTFREAGNVAALDAPLLSTSEWTNVAVRSMLYRAAREGFQSISFPTAETSEIIQGNDSAAMHYETNVKGALEKLAKQLGGEVRKGGVEYPAGARWRVQDSQGAEYETYDTERAAINASWLNRRFKDIEQVDGGAAKASAYILDITPAMRAKIMSEGFPLFQTGDDKGRATPPPNLPPMRLNLQAVKEQYGEQALAEIPPDVAAYSAEANDVEAYVQIARDVRKTLNETPPKSLWKFLSTPRNIGQGEGRISYRGIRDTDGELLKIIGEKKAARGLIADPTKDSKRSRSYDMQQAIEAAWEAGYFDGEDLPTPAQFLDTLRADIDGQAPRYRRDDIPTVSTIAGAERWKDWFEQNDLDITSDVATLRAKLATVLTGQGTSAIGPDEAAEVFNGVIGQAAFPTGFDLLKALKQGPLRDKLIRDLTEQRMIERNGDVFRDGTIMQEAEAYARNEVQHRQFEIELEALAEAAGKGTAGALAKQTAIENLRSKQVREVLNYTQWLTLERRWGEKAIKAAAKGDTAQAAEFARFRLINSHMYAQGKLLAEKIEKTRKHLLDYGKKAKQVRLFAAGKEYADQMNGLLDDYQFRNESKKGENKRATRAVWLQAQMAGLDPFAAYADPTKSPQEQAMAAAEMIERSAVLGRLAEGVDARNYKSITVEEMLAVRDEADLIYKLATLKDRLLKVGERRRMSLLAGDIVASVSANQPKVLPPEPLESNLRGEKIKRAISGFMVSHRTFQALARQFDGGKDGGVFWRLIVRPLNDAFARKTVLMKQVGKDVEKLFSPFSSAELGRFMRDRQTITLNAADGSSTRVTLTTQGRLAVAMNAGNEKNLARLMDSNGWDRLQVQAIIDTLSKREMDFVQATWDYLETWFAEANRVHEAVHGVPMDKQEPLQLATRHGIYAGGYFPIAFDPNRSSKSGQRKLEADAQATGAGRVGVRNEPGFAKKRVSGKVTLPLNLDPFAVILRHLDQVTTSIATEEVLFDVGRLIKLPEVENVIVERHGRVKYDEIIEAIKAAKFGLPVAQGAVEKILNHVRNGSTVAKLGWSVSTAMLQPSGISNSIVRVGFPWMMRGYGRMLGSAAQREGWAKWAMERSEFMRNRRESQSPEQVNLLATLKGNKPLVMIQRSAFQLMAQVQFFSVDLATWYGAFDKATAGGADEALAVSMADQAVLDAQGGGEAFQTAGIQRGSVGVRLLTNLMSYMLTTYQLSVQSVATKDPNLLTKIARISADMVLLWSVPVAATMAIRYAIAAAIGGDDEDDEEYWSLENISREQASFLMSPFFGLSQVAGAVKMDPYEYRGPAGLDMLVQSYKAMDAASHGDTDQLLRPLNQMVGMAFHLPANQIDKTVRGSLALWNGETDSPLAIFFGPPPK